MRKKSWVARKKIADYWVSVWVSHWFDNKWKTGLVICKSMRASNDWYRNKKNKRANNLKLKTVNAPSKALCSSGALLKKLISKLPNGTLLITEHDDERREVISKYLERLGFTPFQVCERKVWLLKVVHPEEVK